MNYVEKIKKFKAENKGLMSENQYLHVGHLLNDMKPCNFLIFGLGEDSFLWNDINSGGKCVFLEDNLEWIEKFKNSGLDIRSIVYNTHVSDFENLVNDEKRLQLDLPNDVKSTAWDLVLVAAPLGHGPINPSLGRGSGRPFNGPGRMSSIFEASRLVRRNGMVIIDDLGRLAESIYAVNYFGNEAVVVENKLGFFDNRHNKNAGYYTAEG